MSVRLILALHYHQPVGNFDHVFEEAVRNCYRPVLEHFERHPGAKAAFHFSGCLLEWLEGHDPRLLDSLFGLVARGQVEPLGGGFYEPILSVIPRDDATEQIQRLAEYWRKRTGIRPQGIWLAERVWEPSLPELLSDADVKYTILDDQHLRFAGLLDKRFSGIYSTERAGKSVGFFPSDFKLRYMIPFRTIESMQDHFNADLTNPADQVLTYGDDAEKFGLWPKTHAWVFGERWLERFLSLVENGDHFPRSITPSEFLAENPPAKKVYVPNASYSEMLEWSLPSSSVPEYVRARTAAMSATNEEAVKAFVRGSLWDMFLARYPESDQMHKHAVRSSRLARNLKRPELREKALTSVLRAQCNCAYWHGLFGGIYLSHLRHGIYRNLLDADAWIAEERGPGVNISAEDIDGDFSKEVILSTRDVQAFFRPSDAGTLNELDFLPSRFNVANVVSRWKESYHEGNDLTHRSEGAAGVKSPHENALGISSEALRNYTFDSIPVRSFREFTADRPLSPGDLKSWSGIRLASGELKNFEMHERGFAGDVTLGSITLRKSVSMNTDGELNLKLGPINFGGSASGWFGTTLYFTLLAREAPDRSMTLTYADGKESKSAPSAALEADNASGFEMRDDCFGFTLRVELKSPARITTVPIDTLQRSEMGYESVYQGTLIAIAWPASAIEGSGLRVSFRKNDA